MACYSPELSASGSLTIGAPAQMDSFIERTNIAHYKELLKDEIDPAKRKILLELLAEEEAKQANHFKPRA